MQDAGSFRQAYGRSNAAQNETDGASIDTKHRLSLLPNEVLLHIWIHLDDPASLALTNKRFRALSQDTLWRAKWFMQRHVLYEVIFYAIARAKLFNSALFEQLIRLGAPLSRNLVQLLHFLRDPKLRSDLLQHETKWGQITFTSYVAVLQHAARLYGDSLTFELRSCDSSEFIDWLWGAGRAIPEESIRRMFSEGFMPLPLVLQAREGRTAEIAQREHDCFQRAAAFDRALCAILFANGWKMSDGDFEAIINLVGDMNEGCDTRQAVRMLEELPLDHVLDVSKEYARWVIRYDRESSREYQQADDSADEAQQEHDAIEREEFDGRSWRDKHYLLQILMLLEKSGRLFFKLQEVLDSMSASEGYTESRWLEMQHSRSLQASHRPEM